MQGVTTAIVGFLFVCIVFPSLIKNKTQYYAALAMAMVIILLEGLAGAIGRSGFTSFAYMMTALLQIGAILVLILAAGGLSVRDLAGDFAHAYEVIRRGEEDKEIIIPRTGEMPKVKDEDEEEPRPVRINLETPVAKPGKEGKEGKEPNKSIPLD